MRLDLLSILGLSRSGLQNNKDGTPIVSGGNNGGEITEKVRKVKFQDKPETMQPQTIINHGGSGGRQLVPGLLLVQQENSGRC